MALRPMHGSLYVFMKIKNIHLLAYYIFNILIYQYLIERTKREGMHTSLPRKLDRFAQGPPTSWANLLRWGPNFSWVPRTFVSIN